MKVFQILGWALGTIVGLIGALLVGVLGFTVWVAAQFITLGALILGFIWFILWDAWTDRKRKNTAE